MDPAAARKPHGPPRKIVADAGSKSKHHHVSESHAQNLFPLVVVKRLTADDVAVGVRGSRHAGETGQSVCPGDDQQLSGQLHDADEDDHFGERLILGCTAVCL